MSDKPITVRPKIEIPDLARFGVSDFGDGYSKFSRLEKEVFWQTLLSIGFQLVSTRGVQGRSYHRLLAMMQNAFPEMEIDESIFEQFTPQLSIAGGFTEGSSPVKSGSTDSPVPSSVSAPAEVADKRKESKSAADQGLPESESESNFGSGYGPGAGPVAEMPSGASPFSGLIV